MVTDGQKINNMKKMRRIVLCVILAALLTAFSGCSAVRALFGGSIMYGDLPADAAELPETESGGCRGVIVNGRSYAFFGTQNGRITDKQLERCVGWVGGDTNDRIYTLRDTDDFIAEYYVGGMMEQLHFYRALDTAGEQIPVPDYITDLEYEFWDQ